MEDKNYSDSLSYVLEKKNIIVLRTFSKIAGIAGVRIGYGIAKPELIGYLNRVVNPLGTPYENEKFIQALKEIMSS